MSRQKRSIDRWIVPAADLQRRLRRARQDANITQEDLARKTDLSLAALRKIEGGWTQEPGIFTVLALWRALQLPVAELEELLPNDE